MDSIGASMVAYRHLAVAALLTVTAHSLAQGPNSSAPNDPSVWISTRSLVMWGSTWTIRAVARPFVPRLHHMGSSAQEPRRIDGRIAWGVGPSDPSVQLTSLTLSSNKRKLKIPKPLVTTCFDPWLRPGRNDQDPLYLSGIKVAKRRNLIVIRLNGADGAGAYAVEWTMDRHGHAKRKIWSIA